MNIIRLQGYDEYKAGIYYEYDADDRPLGEGGMGRVFKGFRVDQRTGEKTPVAIKAIYENIPERIVERARREAEIRVDHDNLIRMYGFVEVVSPATDNSPAMVHYHVIMELLVGVTLEDLLNGITADRHCNQIPFAAEIYSQYQNNRVAAAARIMKAVLSGLMSLHDRGIIHRDIDPSNIMLTDDGKIKLIDFGICKKIVTLGSVDKGLTVAGVFMGKVNYAAPELVIGDVRSQNRTTDLYALGVLLYQLITGHLPFSGTDEEVLSSHLHKTLPLKDVKRKDIKQIIRKATEKQQDKRYKSAAEMRVDIEHVDTDSKPPKSSLKLIIIAAAVLAAVVVTAIVVFSGKKTSVPDNIHILQDSTVVADPDAARLMTDALAYMERESPDSAAVGLEILTALAADSAYTPAMLEMGILRAKATMPFKDLQYRQSKLALRPDLKVSNEWLMKVLDKEPDNYKAAYWLYNNLMTKFDESSLSPSEISLLSSTFSKFVQLVSDSTDGEAVLYRDAMISAGDADTLKAWALIN